MIRLPHLDDLQHWRAAVRRNGQTLGLVPTMGYLHEGHLSLIRRAAAENDAVVVSLYVNPLQFGPTEDLAAYPRDLERDARLAEQAGAAALFHPGDDDIYPAGPAAHRTIVHVRGISETLCGVSRPTHFDGVATVVCKLFQLVRPERAYLGQKDYQQTLVVGTMARDLNLPVEVRVVPTVRDADGLALSSRNTYLTPEERAAAPVLHRTLEEAAARIRSGERDAQAVAAFMREAIGAVPEARLDYAEVVAADTLAPLSRLEGTVLLAVACYFGKARLIDNTLVEVPA